MSRVVAVVDASVLVELVRRSEAARRAEAELRTAVLAAPAHLDAEAFSALARLRRAGDLDDAQVAEGLAGIARAPIARFPVAGLLGEAWALRGNVAARDALYVTLARRLGARLVTRDARLAGAPGLAVSVTVV